MKHVVILTLMLLFVFIVINAKHCMYLNDTNLEHLWDDYKRTFEKNYHGHIDKRRKAAWIKNCKKIQKHNEKAEKGIHSFTLSANHLADMSLHHYHLSMIKLIHSARRDVSDPEMVGGTRIDYNKIPEEIDWREKGFATSPNNQKDCGSCYAFSIAQSVQAQLFKQTHDLEPLSEQQIIDCSFNMGNHGCGGGSLRNTLKYLDDAGGLMSAKDYPYAAKQTSCKFNKEKIMANLSSWAILPPRDEQAMEAIVGNVGPVAASINASPHTFQLYKSGIYDDPICASHIVNHAMLVVGYTKDAWILKNWWGNKWGENGYMRLRKNKNLCGVSNYVAYVIV